MNNFLFCAILFPGFIDPTLNGLSQDDPSLIETIKGLLIPPPEKSLPYNFDVEDSALTMTGQFNQVQ